MRFNKCITLKNKIFNNINYYLLNYICGITSIYFLCEILKNLYFVNTTNIHYNTCIELLSKEIRMKDVYRICQNLNNVTTYQTCFHNLFITLIVIISLLEINKNINYKYWIVSHLSAFIYTYICQFKMFQFSIASNTKYSLSRIIILTIVGIVLLVGMLRNILYKKIKYQYIINYLCCYGILFLLFRFVSNNVIYHFHHSLVCIFVSYFFTDWSSKINLLIHAILLGIIVQGLNFFYIDEFSMFYISNLLYPKIYQLLQIYGILGIIWIIIFTKLFFHNKKKNRIEIDNEFEIPLLIPSQEELNEYN